jgi:hypothetical protein
MSAQTGGFDTSYLSVRSVATIAGAFDLRPDMPCPLRICTRELTGLNDRILFYEEGQYIHASVRPRGRIRNLSALPLTAST